jgi:hypothetical protein
MDDFTKENLQEQLNRQNKMIQGLQNEIGILTGERIAASVAYQEVQQELEQIRVDQIAEMDKQAYAENSSTKESKTNKKD